MSGMNKDIVCIACSIFRVEIEELKKRGDVDFPVRYINSMLHMRPEELKVKIDEMIVEERKKGKRILLLFGECHPYMHELEEPGVVSRVSGMNCPEIMLGREKYNALRNEGSFFLMPEWTRRWKEVFEKELGLAKEVGRELMGDVHEKLVYLDSGMAHIPKSELEEASDYSGLPYGVLPLSLTHLLKGIEDALEVLAMVEMDGDKGDPVQRAAFHGMVYNMIRDILSSTDNPGKMGKYITENVRELTGARAVILFQCLESFVGEGNRAIDVNPYRKKGIAHSKEIQRLAELINSNDKTVVFQDCANGSEAEKILARKKCGLAAGTPLKVGDMPLGSLILLGIPDLHSVHLVSEALDTCATAVALVFRNALLFENQEKIIEKRTKELEQRALQQEAVASLGLRALSEEDMNVFLDEAVSSISRTLDMEFCKVLELLPGGKSLRLIAGKGWKEGAVGEATVGTDLESQAGYTLVTDSPVVVENLKEEPRFSGPPLLHEHGVKSGISTVIYGGKGPFGVLGIHSGSQRKFSRNDVNFVQSVSNLISEFIRRKETEDALRNERGRLAVTLHSIGDGVIATDREGRIVLLNSVAEELTGWTQREAVKKPFIEVFHIINEKTRERCENPVEIVLKTGGIVGLANHTMLLSRGGQEYFIADSGAPIRGGDGSISGVVLVFRDVSAERRAEEERIRAQKLESLGVLAGGIAHGFNNILTAVMGNVSVAKIYSKGDEEVIGRLSEAEDAITRARGLTNQLLTFSKGGAPIKKTQHIGRLIRESADFVLSGSNVKCNYYIPRDLWPVDLDASQFGQVISNLAINADQAMPGGGEILISCQNVEIPEGEMPISPGGYVKVTVKDGGIGISEEHLDKVFDPYFTMKQKGSGLGLTTSYSIVKNHDGLIEMDSVLGEGTAIHIYLPASESKIVMEIEEEGDLIQGEGRILLMDDEEVVREVCRGMLESLGYEVEEASDGKEAAEKYRYALDGGTPFDGVIMDLTVPGGMGGKEAVKTILELDPGAAVIISSGYSNDPIMSNCEEYGFKGVLVKPYRVVELSRILSKVLHKD